MFLSLVTSKSLEATAMHGVTCNYLTPLTYAQSMQSECEKSTNLQSVHCKTGIGV